MFHYKHSRGGVALCLLGVLILSAVFFLGKNTEETTQERARDDVRVGLILPLSGHMQKVGKASELGAELAQADIETARTGESVPLMLAIRDSALNAEQAQDAAEVLVKDEQVDVLFSSHSLVTGAVSGVSLDEDIPLFYDSCNCGFAEENPHAFQTFFDPRKECRSAAEALQAKDPGAKAAYMSIDVPQAHFCFEEMQDVLGEDNVFIHIEDPQKPRHPKDILRDVAAFGARTLVSVPAVRDFALLFNTNLKREEPLTIICFAGTCLDKAVRERTDPDALEHVIGFTFALQEIFEARLDEHDPDMTHAERVEVALTYDAVMYAYEAAATCPKGDKACIVEHIESNKTYVPQVISEQFDDEHILRYTTRYLQIINKSEIIVSLEDVFY